MGTESVGVCPLTSACLQSSGVTTAFEVDPPTFDGLVGPWAGRDRSSARPSRSGRRTGSRHPGHPSCVLASICGLDACSVLALEEHCA